MKRDLDRLAGDNFDVLVIGGGIHGLFVAWDAALRGLSVALIERGDFGASTSANSLKTIHGGMRYFQDGDLRTVRMMIRERATWFRIAPHLIRPLPFLVPTLKELRWHRLAFRAALAANDLLAWGTDRTAGAAKKLPRSRLLSPGDFYEKAGWMPHGTTGAALWYDAQMQDSERLLLAVVLAAAERGAVLANYVSATRFLGSENAVTGVKARDELTGIEFDIGARIVVNCAGAWIGDLLEQFNGRIHSHTNRTSLAANIITRKLCDDYALGFPTVHDGGEGNGRGDAKKRLLFLVPWQDHSLIGTWHLPLNGPIENARLDEQHVQSFLDEFNGAYPLAQLTLRDVKHVHLGYLPLDVRSSPSGPLRLLRKGTVRDHARIDGIENLLTVSGVKYSTARRLAEKTVDRVTQRLGVRQPCRTATTPLSGGDIGDIDTFFSQVIRAGRDSVNSDSLAHLGRAYGSGYGKVLSLVNENPDWAETVAADSPVIKAQVVHAVREEMAVTLEDVVRRRTSLGAAGLPDDVVLECCANIVRSELHWTRDHCSREVAAVAASYRPMEKLHPSRLEVVV